MKNCTAGLNNDVALYHESASLRLFVRALTRSTAYNAASQRPLIRAESFYTQKLTINKAFVLLLYVSIFK